MIFSVILILSVSAFCIDAQQATTPSPAQLREIYDRLLLEVINTRISFAEDFLRRLNHQLNQYKTSKSAELRDRINEDLAFVIPIVKALDHHFDVELKRTDLDILQKYDLEKADSEAKIIVEALTAVQNEVKKVTANPPVRSNATVDWRQEYDSVLFELIEERTTLADVELLRLQQQLSEYKKTNSATVKEAIIDQVDIITPLLKETRVNAQKQLNRTDLNHLERFLYEKANDQLALLVKHYTNIENLLKSNVTSVAFEYYANTTEVNWRQEIDQLLFEFIELNVRRVDTLLVDLYRDYQLYHDTKDKAVLDRIIDEVDFNLPIFQAVKVRVTEALLRTDLDDVETYLFEKALDEINLLSKHFAALEKEAKAITTA